MARKRPTLNILVLANGEVVQAFKNVAEKDVLSFIGAAMASSGNPKQRFVVRVEDDGCNGYWMEIKAQAS